MEHKTFPAFNVKVDEAQGIVEHLIAVMGNADMGDDIIHPGAFTKTLSERGGKIRVLDQHQTDSVLKVLGKPLAIMEVARADLPLEVIQKYPDASGGVKAVTQYNLKTQAGHDSFQHILAGDVNEYSIGYDPAKGGWDFTKIKLADGTEKTVRNLRELKLWEYSPVLWGMNPATVTMSAKADEPSEGKPWNVFKRGDKWAVYKVDADGNPTGEALGTHDTEEEAQAQIRALHANVHKDEAGPSEGKPVETTGDYVRVRVKDPGAFQDDSFRTIDISKDEGIQAVIGRLQSETSTTVQSYLFDKEKWTEAEARRWVEEHKKDAVPELETKVGRRLRSDRVAQLRAFKEQVNKEIDDFIKWAEYGDEDESNATPEGEAAQDSQPQQAGPDVATPPTPKGAGPGEQSPTEAELAQQIQTLELELAMSEV